jgi:enoyl-CoA hydratase
MMGEYENVKLTVQDGIATVLLDRPPVNAISTALYKDIAAVFAEIGDRTDEIRVAILTGNGRCFCAGRDLKLTETEPWEARARHTRAAFSAVYRSAVPVIAAVNGPAMGAGFIMTVLCDIVVAAENAVFCLPEIDAGLNMSIATLRRVFNEHQARYLAFTGERVSPAELYRLGAINRVVPPDQLIPEATAIATVLAAKAPETLRAAKWSGNEVETLFANFEQAYRAIESRVSMALFSTKDRQEAGRAFAEKRAPVFAHMKSDEPTSAS